GNECSSSSLLPKSVVKRLWYLGGGGLLLALFEKNDCRPLASREWEGLHEREEITVQACQFLAVLVGMLLPVDAPTATGAIVESSAHAALLPTCSRCSRAIYCW